MANVNLSEQDIIDIAKVAQTEADPKKPNTQKDYVKQIQSVVDVITNRVASSSFPDSVKGVVDAKAQFSAISGNKDAYGSVDKAPDPSPEVLSAVLDHIAERAVGKPSVVGQSLQYYNPDLASPKWGPELKANLVGKIGKGARSHIYGVLNWQKPAGTYALNPPVNYNKIAKMAPLPEVAKTIGVLNARARGIADKDDPFGAKIDPKQAIATGIPAVPTARPDPIAVSPHDELTTIAQDRQQKYDKTGINPITAYGKSAQRAALQAANLAVRTTGIPMDQVPQNRVSVVAVPGSLVRDIYDPYSIDYAKPQQDFSAQKQSLAAANAPTIAAPVTPVESMSLGNIMAVPSLPQAVPSNYQQAVASRPDVTNKDTIETLSGPIAAGSYQGPPTAQSQAYSAAITNKDTPPSVAAPAGARSVVDAGLHDELGTAPSLAAQMASYGAGRRAAEATIADAKAERAKTGMTPATAYAPAPIAAPVEETPTGVRGRGLPAVINPEFNVVAGVPVGPQPPQKGSIVGGLVETITGGRLSPGAGGPVSRAANATIGANGLPAGFVAANPSGVQGGLSNKTGYNAATNSTFNATTGITTSFDPGGAEGGTATVLCTHYHNKGWLPDDVYASDALYGMTVDDRIMRFYHWWAKPLVKILERSPLLERVFYYPVAAWAWSMYRGYRRLA